MTTLYFKRKALLAKIESSYGTDSVPTGGANAMVVNNLAVTPLEAALNERNTVLPYYGTQGKVPGGGFVRAEFSVEMAGAGALGDVPAYGPLLRACGKLQTNNASAGIVYTPKSVSDAAESVTMYFYIDGVLHKMTGCVGNVVIEGAHEALPQFKFAVAGLFNTVADAALPTVDLTNFATPLPLNKTNTTFSLHGYSAILSKLTLDSGAQVETKDYVNSAQQVRITDRVPGGNVTIEAGLVADKDWFGIARAATQGVLSMQHGTVEGNKVVISCPAVQIENPAYADENGVAMLEIPLGILPSSGNDEISITVE